MVIQKGIMREHVINGVVFGKVETKITFTVNIRKRQLKIRWHITRKEGSENLIVTGQIEGKRERGRQRITYLTRREGKTGFRRDR